MSDFRIKTAFFTHHKTALLKRLGGREAVYSLLCLIGYAASHRPTGDLSGMSLDDIAAAADWPGAAAQLVGWLVEAGFLDGEPGAYRIHDYVQHQPYVATGPARSAAARAAVMIRWHRAGRHVIEVDGCPLCASDSNASASPNRCKPDANGDAQPQQKRGSECKPMQTGCKPDTTVMHDAMHDTTVERSALRRKAANIRWHRAGKHLQKVADCPECACIDDANGGTVPMQTGCKPDAKCMQTDANLHASAMQTGCKVHDASFQANRNRAGLVRVSEIDALHDTPVLRSNKNRITPYPDLDLNDRISEVVQTGESCISQPSRPRPSSTSTSTAHVPDGASAAKLNDVAQHEWGWYPLTPAQTLRAIKLEPFSATELAAALTVVEQRDAGRKTRGKLGLLLAVIESARNGGGAKPSNRSSMQPERHQWEQRLCDKDEAFLREHVAWCRMHQRTGDATRAAAELERVRDEWLTRRGQERADEILQ